MSNKIGLIAKLSVFSFLVYFAQDSLAAVSATHSHKVIVAAEPAKVTPQILLPSSQSKSTEKPVAIVPSPVSEMIPAPPDFDVKSYILIDANSGYVIAEKNASLRGAPASLTKLMTLYLTASALRSGKIHLTDQVLVSENAWRTGGSRMFIKVGTSVAIQDLIKGIATASGNDATVAMAEHLAGSEQSFISLMNQTAHSLKMDGTNYADSSGLPNANNYSTASDLATLARAWISNFPEYYPWFKEKWITYNGIRQPNRNRLLWRDPSVDGMKTGHTSDAGYCLVASAVRGGMRLISVIMGAKGDAVRAKDSMALLNYGFRFFETRKLFAANTSLATPKVFLGKNKISNLGLQEDLYVTLPAAQYKNVKAKAMIDNNLKAPIVKGKAYGSLNILSGNDNKIIATRPLVALQDNPRANFIFVIFDYILMLFHK